MRMPVWRRLTTVAAMLAVGAAAAYLISYPRAQAQAQEDFTPGMLFGPLYVAPGQHIELCAANLGPGDLRAVVHFRNITTGEVTALEGVDVVQGGGGCAHYTGEGHVVGMARGDGRASDWVSPSNALISTMSVVDNDGSVRASVLGNAKLWLRGL